MRGRFISFEGGEGAGKSTQVARLAERLRAHGIEVVLTREPGGTPGAEAVRELIVNGTAERWNPITEALLVNAARADHVARLIEPALARGAWVVCDRFVDSTLAYQGAGKGLDETLLRQLHEMAAGGLLPDLTLILDLDVAAGLARANARRGSVDRFEGHDRAFHERVRNGFRAIATNDPRRCRLIDAGRRVEEVAEAIWQAVAPLTAD